LIRAARRRAGALMAGMGLALWLMPAMAQESLSGLHAPDLFALAERDVNADRPADALAIYVALARDPDIEVRSEARFRRGMLLGALKRYAEAAVEFRAFLDEKPGVARVELELARVLTAMGDERAAPCARRRHPDCRAMSRSWSTSSRRRCDLPGIWADRWRSRWRPTATSIARPVHARSTR
jgi:hypothetical protein